MLLDWLAVAFLCTVFLLVLRLVSVVVLWFALPTVGSAVLLLALVPSRILTTCSLAAVPSVIVSSESLCGMLRLRGSFLASSNVTTQRCALRD